MHGRKKRPRHSAFAGLWDELINFDHFGMNPWNRFPATNIRETDESYLVELVVPGRKKEDIKLHLEKDTLVVSSETGNKHEEDDSYRHREFHLAPFRRSFRLPEAANADAITATYTDGILTVTVGKKDTVKVQKEIEIL